jgi:biotin carboxyl carrier protein
MKLFAGIRDKVWTFEEIENNGTSYLQDKSSPIHYSFTSLGNNRFVFILNGTSHLVHIIKENSLYHVHLDGDYFSVRVEDERSRELRNLVEHATQASGDQTIIAPIPGLITKIKVKEGDTIKKGDGLISLEAMKMENEIKSESDGIVKKVMIKEGISVEKNQALLVIGHNNV